jgi:hypothetical protein
MKSGGTADRGGWESAFVRLLSSRGRDVGQVCNLSIWPDRLQTCPHVTHASAGSSAAAGGYRALFTASSSRSIANGLRM